MYFSEIKDYFLDLNPIMQALAATTFTWLVTAMGASLVFFVKTLRRKLLDGMLGFTGGVMIAASYWSLLAPSIEIAEYQGLPPWLPAAVGFIAGAVFLFFLDKIIPHLHINFRSSEKEGIKTDWNRTILLVSAITLHNIPEGLAVGVAFGA
ncbi:MAG: ZIP family metal transporter, partial [Bacteroidetes bacterium]|nr:ZIP family metal transporter [Bacteroidota bacterium]